MLRHRRRLHVLALWLALAGVFYRALIPAGLMPAFGGSAQHGFVLTLCAGGTLKSFAGDSHRSPATSADHGVGQCPFAMAGAAPPAAIVAFPVAHQADIVVASRPVAAIASASRSRPPARAPPVLS
jgi:hypothetical protein